MTNLAKDLKLRDKSVQAAIRKIVNAGVPIEMSMSNDDDRAYRADPSEPISWFIKEKESAERMLDLIGESPLNGNEDANKKKNINYRIYEEYVETLNELFDRWTSLRLLEQLESGEESE